MDIVTKYTVLCAVVSRIPSWWANSPSVTGLQLKMLAEVSSVYGVEFQQDLVRPMIGSFAGGGLSVLVSRNPLSMAFKSWLAAVPIVGVPLRLTIGPVVVGTYCYLLGRTFIQHYEAGGTYRDFSAAKLRASVRAALTPVQA